MMPTATTSTKPRQGRSKGTSNEEKSEFPVCGRRPSLTLVTKEACMDGTTFVTKIQRPMRWVALVLLVVAVASAGSGCRFWPGWQHIGSRAHRHARSSSCRSLARRNRSAGQTMCGSIVTGTCLLRLHIPALCSRHSGAGLHRCVCCSRMLRSCRRKLSRNGRRRAGNHCPHRHRPFGQDAQSQG